MKGSPVCWQAKNRYGRKTNQGTVMQLTLFAKRAFASGPAKALANGTLDCVQKLFVDLQHKLHVSTFWGKVGPIFFGSSAF
jgi:hypothetical protein